jgi:phasin family protein
MSDARPSFFDYDVTKIFADFRFPPVNVEAMWAAQRRNIEALSQANQLAVEGVQAMARRQFEMTRQGVEEFSAMLRDMAQPVSPEERITKNTEFAKQMIEKGVNHTREIAMLASKTGTEAAEVLHKRASESLDEMRAAIAPNGK